MKHLHVVAEGDRPSAGAHFAARAVPFLRTHWRSVLYGTGILALVVGWVASTLFKLPVPTSLIAIGVLVAVVMAVRNANVVHVHHHHHGDSQ